ncbi:MAG: hypothetical protein HIU92_09375 [Proteobacteria bacterium]|nr:hypothetical protein [Pseudomonadota bacterium]
MREGVAVQGPILQLEGPDSRPRPVLRPVETPVFVHPTATATANDRGYDDDDGYTEIQYGKPRRRGRLFVGIGCVLVLAALAVAGTLNYSRLRSAGVSLITAFQTPTPAATKAAAAEPQAAQSEAPQSQAPQSQAQLASASETPSLAAGIGHGAGSSFPSQPVAPAPPQMLTQWANTLSIPRPVEKLPRSASAARSATEGRSTAATPSPEASSSGQASTSHSATNPPATTPPATAENAAPQAAAPAQLPAVTATPAADTQPSGAPVLLQIIYAPAGAAEAARVAVFADRLTGAVGNVGAVSASPGRVRREGVVYYYPSDRDAAERVAASLARLTGRREAAILIHAKSRPAHGTVEVLMSLRR